MRDGRASPSRVAASQRTELAAELRTEYEATPGTIGNLAQKHGLGYHLVRALLHEAGASIRQGSQV
ncbi:helix-turn-helix domain-containing protein [Streptomyces tendae]|uniref:helix-turn-helix domain-containing protein n=1 Tax=Streptomyces tendae TaxID=1932 RepID=UPI003F4D9737